MVSRRRRFAALVCVYTAWYGISYSDSDSDSDSHDNQVGAKYNAEPLSPLPVPKAEPAQMQENSSQGKPGYYKLDETMLKDKGVPRYIYVGEDKPADLVWTFLAA